MLLWAGPTLFTLFSVFEHNGGYGQTRYHIHPPMAHGGSCMPSALFKGISTREVRPIWFRKQTLSYSFPLSLSLQAYCSKYIYIKDRGAMRPTARVSSAICIPDTFYFIRFFICCLCSVSNPANPLPGPPGRDGPADCTGSIC